MTAPIHPEGWTSTAANGCTAPGCGTQDTRVLCPCHGRRCEQHDEHEGELCRS